MHPGRGGQPKVHFPVGVGYLVFLGWAMCVKLRCPREPMESTFEAQKNLEIRGSGMLWGGKSFWGLQVWYVLCIAIWLFPKIMVPPNHPF